MCNSLLQDRYTIFSLIIATVFAAIFSFISIMRYLALTQNVFDLGVSANLLYSVGHGGLFPTANNPKPLVFAKLIYIPLGILYNIYPHEWMLLIYQDVFLSISPIAIYLIGREMGFGKRISLSFELIYFFYYPLSGVYWFDFHFMAFFPTLFLFGILMYIRGSKFWIPLMLLASITDYMAPIIVGWFLMVEIMKIVFKERSVSRVSNQAIMILVMLALFILPTLYSGKPYYSNYMSVQNYGSLYLTETLKYDFIARVLLPVLFIPLVALEYASLLLPYAIFVYFNTYAPYQDLMFFQYGALYTPLVMFSLVVGLSRIQSKMVNKFGKSKGKIALKGIVSIILVVNLLLFSLYTPIGTAYDGSLAKTSLNPSLTGSAQYYQFYQKITPLPYDQAIMNMMGKIPAGSSVLVQGNLPELCQGYNSSVTIQSLTHPPQYFIDDPYNYQFYDLIPPTMVGYRNITFLQATNILLQTNDYILVDSYEGASLYELGSSGSPDCFVPLQYNISYLANNSQTFIPFLAPGNYSISIYDLSGTNVSLMLGNTTLQPVSETAGTYFFDYRCSLYESNVQILFHGINQYSSSVNITQGEL